MQEITEYPTYGRKPYPLKTYLGGIPIIPILSGLLTIAGAGGWFTKAEWAGEIAGRLTDNKATGGIVDELEAQTGRSYPHLHRLRQKVVDEWRWFQRALPWNKARAAGDYHNAVQELSKAVQREIEAYQREMSPLGAVTALGEAIASPEWWRRYLPWMGVGGAAIVLIIILAKKAKKK